MWTTNYRNSSRLWIHEFDNGYKVLTDLDLKENRLLNADNELVGVTPFDKDYALDDHMRYLRTVDDFDAEAAGRKLRCAMHEFGDI
jgi:hypothetical protein